MDLGLVVQATLSPRALGLLGEGIKVYWPNGLGFRVHEIQAWGGQIMFMVYLHPAKPACLIWCYVLYFCGGFLRKDKGSIQVGFR